MGATFWADEDPGVAFATLIADAGDAYSPVSDFEASVINSDDGAGSTSTAKVTRAILSFNTSGIPNNATITGVTLTLRVTGRYGTSNGHDVYVSSSAGWGASPDASDFSGGKGGTKWSSVSNVSASVGTDISCLFNSAGRAGINKTGITYVCLESYWDALETEPTYIANQERGMTFSNTNGLKPYLTVTWEYPDQEVTPAAKSITATVPAPTVSYGHVVTPDTVAVSINIPAPELSGGEVLIMPSVVAIPITVDWGVVAPYDGFALPDTVNAGIIVSAPVVKNIPRFNTPTDIVSDEFATGLNDTALLDFLLRGKGDEEIQLDQADSVTWTLTDASGSTVASGTATVIDSAKGEVGINWTSGLVSEAGTYYLQFTINWTASITTSVPTSGPRRFLVSSI